MIEDTLENAFDEEDLEEEADKEVEKVLFDITDGKRLLSIKETQFLTFRFNGNGWICWTRVNCRKGNTNSFSLNSC